MKSYIIKKAVKPVNFAALLSSGVWDDANVAKIDNIREESSCHHPETTLRMLYNNDGIFGRFEVKDRYVRCVAEKFQDPVCLDSCVELFIEPAGNNGYINFEFSGAGVFLSSHIKDSRRTAGGFADYRMLTGEDAAGIVCASTLPRKTDPEIPQESLHSENLRGVSRGTRKPSGASSSAHNLRQPEAVSARTASLRRGPAAHGAALFLFQSFLSLKSN